MTISASGLKAGMHLAMDCAYIRIERVRRETHGMIAAYVRSATGTVVPVLFHSDESLTVGA